MDDIFGWNSSQGLIARTSPGEFLGQKGQPKTLEVVSALRDGASRTCRSLLVPLPLIRDSTSYHARQLELANRGKKYIYANVAEKLWKGL